MCSGGGGGGGSLLEQASNPAFRAALARREGINPDAGTTPIPPAGGGGDPPAPEAPDPVEPNTPGGPGTDTDMKPKPRRGIRKRAASATPLTNNDGGAGPGFTSGSGLKM